MSADITHPVVAPCQPPDSGIKVWRYMDVTKLVALMQSRSLHFARADTLGDRFEGSLHMLNRIANEQMIDKLLEDQENNWSSTVRPTRGQALENLAYIFRRVRQWVFISCWHSGQNESLAMWKQYGSSGGSVVIQSTYQKLLDALPSHTCVAKDESWGSTSIHLGMVQYKNYFSLDEEFAFNSNMLSLYIHKRAAFEYEREVRAFLMSPVGETRSISNVAVNIEFEQLVESIRVRPGTPDWERRTIESLIGKYGLGMKVAPSEIDIEPMF